MAQATKQNLADRHGAMKLATFGTEVERVPVAKIRVDGGTQMRAGLNAETVADYATAMGEYGGWGKFEPIEVYHDGATYWLADGFHRVAAAKEAGVELADAKIHAGDQRKAILHAAGANADHGLRRSNADKRRAVEVLLRDAEWQGWSDSAIAKACKVDPKTVASTREHLVSTMEIHSETERKTADGRTMNTTNIGRKEQPQYASVWQLERRVDDWLKTSTSGDVDRIIEAARDLHSEYGRLLTEDLEESVQFRASDLKQAINNVREQRRQAQLRTSGKVVYTDGAEIPADLVEAGVKFTRNGPSWQYVVPGDGEHTTRPASSLREAVAAVRFLLAARPEPTADPIVIALCHTAEENLDDFVKQATVAQLEAALHAIPTTDKWRWLKIGNRRELLISAQNLGVMNAPERVRRFDPEDDEGAFNEQEYAFARFSQGDPAFQDYYERYGAGDADGEDDPAPTAPDATLPAGWTMEKLPDGQFYASHWPKALEATDRYPSEAAVIAAVQAGAFSSEFHRCWIDFGYLAQHAANDPCFRSARESAPLWMLREALELAQMTHNRKSSVEALGARIRKLEREEAAEAAEAAAPKTELTEPLEYAPYWRLLGAIRNWISGLKSDGESPMLALTVLKKGGGTASYRHSLVEHLRVAGIIYREGDLLRAIDEMHQWHSQLQDATEGQAEAIDEDAPTPTMPADLTTAGYRLVQVDSSYWVWEIGKGDEIFRGNWMDSPAAAIEDAQTDYIGNRRACRVCGCTDENACEGGCWWVEDDLCSACAGRAETSENAPTPDELAAMEIVAAELAGEDAERAARDAQRENPAYNAPVVEAAAPMTFDAWLAAMPPVEDWAGEGRPNMRECAAILELAKAAAKRALDLESSLYNAVYGALPTWSHLIREVGKAAGR